MENHFQPYFENFHVKLSYYFQLMANYTCLLTQSVFSDFIKNFQCFNNTWFISILLVYVCIYEHFQSLTWKLLKEQRKKEPLKSLNCNTNVNFGVRTNFECM